MKTLRKVFLSLIILITFAAIGGYLYWQSLAPQYAGTAALKGLDAPVDVYYDSFGIPHIYAQQQKDLYVALGYVHAQDRLFQMEMLRRVGSGRLSEILGKDFIKIDQFFRTLGIDKASQEAVETLYQPSSASFKTSADAYLSGINAFLENGPTPIEFLLLGIEKQPFTPKDLYNIAGYMSFSFAEAFKTDPLVQALRVKLGESYLQDLHIDWAEDAEKIPIHQPDSIALSAYQSIHSSVKHIMEGLPIPPWIGSNSWVVGPTKTASGKVIFCNDTHIGYSQPAVWYEAHLESPGFSFYGNHLGGFPFALVGHTKSHAWGLTMFENDDVDFYEETLSEDGQKVMFKNEWMEIKTRKETIQVKGEEAYVFEIKETPHGPLINGLVDGVDSLATPTSAWWMYTKKPLHILEAAYGFSHSQSLEAFEKQASLIHAPGLNVMYGDEEGNIAWWAVGQLFERPEHVQPKTFLNGSSGNDEIVRYLDFSFNPKSINPPAGFVYSANNQPDSVKGFFYPGYYVPEDRAQRITKLLEEQNAWTVEKMKVLLNDVTSTVHRKVALEMMDASGLQVGEVMDDARQHVYQRLLNWKGHYQTEAIAPTVLNTWLYYTLKAAFQDEMGEENFQTFLETHLMKRSLLDFIQNDASLFWDDKKTTEKENRMVTLQQGFDSAWVALQAAYGPNPKAWTWGKAHDVTHQHVLAAQKPLDQLFNVGPLSIQGGNETINNQGFYLNGDAKFATKFGPAMRIIIDFAEVEQAESILPTGQSGNVQSEFYSNQAEMFVQGEFRKMLMDEKTIKEEYRYKLVLTP